MPQTGTPLHPSGAILARNFTLDIDGIELGFSEITGMTSEVDVAEVKTQADGKYSLQKIQGAPKPPTLTIKRPADTSKKLAEWHKAAMLGENARKGGSISLHDTKGDTVAQWTFTDAWCSKLVTSTLKAGANDVLMEEATIVMNAFERTK
jgi:phage tail-like protein